MQTLTAHAAKDIRIEEAPLPERGNGVLVQIERGGICGSDLHYYNHGGFGTIRLREPMIRGHEVSGRVIEGPGFQGGELVALSPSRPCGTYRFCQAGHQNHCLNMRIYSLGHALPSHPRRVGNRGH